MENKKLLKFLYKDIAEIEELFQDKGAEGFDEYEREFIGSRFKGAKHILQILTEKENKLGEDAPSKLVAENKTSDLAEKQKPHEVGEKKTEVLRSEEKERLESLAEFEEELKNETQDLPVNGKTEEDMAVDAEGIKTISGNVNQVDRNEEAQDVGIKEEEDTCEEEPMIPVEEATEAKPEPLKKKPEVEVQAAQPGNRLGDNFTKEKSVNELLGVDVSNLEHKISNSPVAKLQNAIGINDRYQFIRELFDGNADAFSKAIQELDGLTTINEAVSYVQQNHKWKKTDVSLKFVSLLKRRFTNE